MDEFEEFTKMSREERIRKMEDAGFLRAKGGRIGFALGGDPYMEDYRNKEADIIPAPGDDMLPDDEQGLVSMLRDEQDPERKIMLAIKIIQSMGDRGIEIVQSILSPEEIAMAVQVIEKAGAITEGGIDEIPLLGEGGSDNVQMAAGGGRIGFANGGRMTPKRGLVDGPGGYQGQGGGGDMAMRRQEIEGQMRRAMSRGDLETARRLGRGDRWSGAPVRDMDDYLYDWLSTSGGKVTGGNYREESFRDPLWQQWHQDRRGVSQAYTDIDAWKKNIIESGDPRGLFSGTISDARYRSDAQKARSQQMLDHYNRMAWALGIDPGEIASSAEAASEVAPWADPEPDPIIYDDEAAATPAEVTPEAVTPGAATPGAATTAATPLSLESASPMTYQPSYTTPTVASPTTDMSQYYSDVLDTPYFDYASPDTASTPAVNTAASLAAQYMTPQEAQIYQGAANGGRIGFQNGGWEADTDVFTYLTPFGQKNYDSLIEQGKSHNDAVGLLERMEGSGSAFLPDQKLAIFNSVSKSPTMTENPSWKRINERYGGRIGFANGGDEDYLLDPGVMQTDPDELLQEIETQGGLQTASSMGDVFMQALEDSAVLELDSWLGKYQPYGLKEDDYFNFRAMGPQVKGPVATEGLATLRV